MTPEVKRRMGKAGSAQKEFTVGGFFTARHLEVGKAQDQDAITFSDPYDTAPKLIFIPQVGRGYLPGNSSVDQYTDLRASSLDVGGFTLVAKVVTGVTTTAIDDGFSTGRNSPAPENGDVTLNSDGDVAYSQLEDEDADTTITTYTVAYDVTRPSSPTQPASTITVHVDVSDATTGGSWTEVASNSYSVGADLSDETLSFDANLLQNYDIRLRLTGLNVSGNYTVTAHGEDNSVPGVEYDRVDGRSQDPMTPNAGDKVLWIAVESAA